ncbi:13474_t:CDS:2 [Funneliformis caledonium]|uniref:13474_t:CDS:1 n=1 Tax=Funneliformis caledonium TaxID=1117310 RepID=A0A9N9HLL9_9GLOM|nr:13474_t:CDS:2 [Funneliformis caledonium]
MNNNNPDSPFVIEAILQKEFTKEELQNQDNIKFGITVALMFLDLTYYQFKYKELLEDDGIEEPLEDNRIEEPLEYNIIDHNGNESFVPFDNESEDSNGQESNS